MLTQIRRIVLRRDAACHVSTTWLPD